MQLKKRDLLTIVALSERLSAKQSWLFYNYLKDVCAKRFYDQDEIKQLLPETVWQWLQTVDYQTLLHTYHMHKISIVTIDDNCYPNRLKEIYLPPIVLFCQGDSLLLQNRCIGIVGGRLHSQYGNEVVQKLLPNLVKKNICIVSGLAKGIDSLAHREALLCNGKTIAVIGNGHSISYPRENQWLYEKIRSNGLIISEYPLHSPPLRFHFPYRNRIIAGISHGLCVIEAKRKSGSLITANVALQENRTVFAVPGSIMSPFSTGCNELIQAGAIPVLQSDDIVQQLNYFA